MTEGIKVVLGHLIVGLFFGFVAAIASYVSGFGLFDLLLHYVVAGIIGFIVSVLAQLILEKYRTTTQADDQRRVLLERQITPIDLSAK